MGGNLQMVRYLFYSCGADCRTSDAHGFSPIHWAAMCGQLEIIKFLCHDGGAHEDIRKEETWNSERIPLRVALLHEQFDVVHWFILNRALHRSLAPRDGGGIVYNTMWYELKQEFAVCEVGWPIDLGWKYDHRLPVLAWAQDAVKNHRRLKLFLKGAIRSSASNKGMTVATASSSLVLLNGNSYILALIAQYVAGGTKAQVNTLHHLRIRLTALIANTPFEEDSDDE